MEYAGKVHSLEQLKKEWEAEDNEVVTTDAYNYSKFGGYKQQQVKATGSSVPKRLATVGGLLTRKAICSFLSAWTV